VRIPLYHVRVAAGDCCSSAKGAVGLSGMSSFFLELLPSKALGGVGHGDVLTFVYD